jgi:very-short-patch-repair endonuclease
MRDVNRPDAPELPRIVSRDGALRLGFSPDAIKHRLASGAWRRVLPRTYLTRDTFTWLDRQRAATTFAGPGALLSGAAALTDLELPAVRRPDSILVLAPPGLGPHSTAWVRVRRSPRPMVRELCPGAPRVATARAVADLSVELRRRDDVRALVADAVRRSLCTVEELAVELREGPRRNSLFLREALEEVAAGAWSAPEARAGTLLRRAGVPRFEQNARIDLPGGRWFVADFLWRELRAILEIDSFAYHSLPPAAEATSDKRLVLETLGYSVVSRQPRQIVHEPQRFVDGITAWLAARAALLAG